jgi:uncharacterized membrane protein YgaE (UPF0421/DUF939 family)
MKSTNAPAVTTIERIADVAIAVAIGVGFAALIFMGASS